MANERGSVRKRWPALAAALSVVIVAGVVAYSRGELTREEYEASGGGKRFRPEVGRVAEGLRVRWGVVSGACKFRVGRVEVESGEVLEWEARGEGTVDEKVDVGRTYGYTVWPIGCDGRAVRGVVPVSVTARME